MKFRQGIIEAEEGEAQLLLNLKFVKVISG